MPPLILPQEPTADDPRPPMATDIRKTAWNVPNVQDVRDVLSDGPVRRAHGFLPRNPTRSRGEDTSKKSLAQWLPFAYT
jgi:hypothetical protein